MGSDALSVAKEITLATIPQIEIGPNKDAEVYGEKVGILFKIIIKQVVEGINEANK
jgi:hypothetical protein